jgi:acetyl esterase
MTETPDPEVRAMLAEMDAAGVPAFHDLSTAGARQFLKSLFAGDDPEPVASTRDLLIPGPDGGDLPVRLYTPAEAGDPPYPTLVWFHGGGFVLGDLETADPACRALANATGRVVVSVDYRLAPEHPFPAPVEDCYAATEWAAAHPEIVRGTGDVAVGGTSAGGTLAAAVALRARDAGGPDLSRQALVYPLTTHPGRDRMPSHGENAEGYLLETADIEWFLDRYLDSPLHAPNPYAFPLEADDLSGVAPATVVTAGFDPLRDEGVAYAETLEAAGVPTVHRHYEGMVHGFFSLLVDPELDRAREAVADVAGDLAD